jgi:hypothetical protein
LRLQVDVEDEKREAHSLDSDTKIGSAKAPHVAVIQSIDAPGSQQIVTVLNMRGNAHKGI